MKRRYKAAIFVCLLILVGGAAVWLWPSGEPELVAKARTLREDMSREQVKAVLGQPDEVSGTGYERGGYCKEWFYLGPRDLRRLFTPQFPFVDWEGYRENHQWFLSVHFDCADSDGVDYRLNSAMYSNSPQTQPWEIPLVRR